MPADANDNSATTHPNMPHLPPEILQMIFCNLDFFDLLRCQRVCKIWRAYLPGDDSKLCNKLFMKDTRLQSVNNDKVCGNGDESSQCSAAVNDEDDYYEHDPEELPMPTLYVTLHANCFHEESPYPSLPEWDSVPMEVGTQVDELPDDTELNPMIEDLDEWMHIIDDQFYQCPDGGLMDPWNHDITKSGDSLKMHIDEERLVQKDGPWKDMLLCLPPLQFVFVIITCNFFHNSERGYMLKAKDGVTVGDFVRAFREEVNRW